MIKTIWTLLLALMTITSSNASEFRHWSDWTTAEKLEYTAFTLVNYTDFAQTERCISMYPKCKEINPILGSKPNDATIAAAFLISQWGYYHLMGTSHYDEAARKTKPFMFAWKLTIVLSNDNQGIKISKVW
jgi:hypothetical protein